MKEPKLDFSRPTGDIGLLLLALSFIAYCILLIVYILDIGSSNIAAMDYFTVVTIVLAVALVLLALNYRQAKKSKKKISDWIVLKQDSKQVLPPLCQKCNYPARWSVEFDSWVCEKCNFFAGPF